MLKLADKKQRFPAWRYTLLGSMCVVAIIGLISGLEPWVICQRMFLAAIGVTVCGMLVQLWFTTLFQ